MVVKADGLAQGKGVVVAATREEAKQAVRDSMEHAVFGQAGQRILIEQFLRRRGTDDHGFHGWPDCGADAAGARS